MRRLQIPAGGWSTPAHEHGREEEIFYVLAGRGLSWQRGKTAEVAAGDCIVYLPRQGAHSLHAVDDLDVLAFGPRHFDESVWFPRLNLVFAGRAAVEATARNVNGVPIQFVRESEIGPPGPPSGIGPPGPPSGIDGGAGPRPPTIVNVEDVAAEPLERPRVVRVRRNLGRAAGSVSTGLQHVKVAPGKENTAQHCHSLEEEIFVILDGDGVLVLGEDEGVPVVPGSVIARPAGTGVAHLLRAGERGLTYLAYGTRDPGDVCYYPRSNKIFFRGVGVIARLERLEYWDGED